jgi:hypothetical protein
MALVDPRRDDGSPQQFEVGVLGGGGFLNGTPVGGTSAAVSAGFAPGAAAGICFSHDRYARWSGEIRYLYAQQDPRLRAGSLTASFSGEAHALEYDMTFHPRLGRKRWRPYVLARSPLMQYGFLTQATDIKPMLTTGGRVRLRTGHFTVRLEF